MKKAIAFLLMGGIVLLLFAGHFFKKYTVSCDEGLNGLGAYRKGETVELVLDIWATDTDYSFFLDGAPVKASFDSNRGYIITFPMPAHDVRVTYDVKNTMYHEQGDTNHP